MYLVFRLHGPYHFRLTYFLWDELVELAGEVAELDVNCHHIIILSPHSQLPLRCQLISSGLDLQKDGVSLFDRLFFQGSARQLIFIDAESLDCALVHRHIRDLFDQVLNQFWKAGRLEAVFVVEWSEVVLMLHICVISLC